MNNKAVIIKVAPNEYKIQNPDGTIDFAPSLHEAVKDLDSYVLQGEVRKEDDVRNEL